MVKKTASLKPVPAVDFTQVPRLGPYAVAADRTEHHKIIGALLAAERDDGTINSSAQLDSFIRMTKAHSVDIDGRQGTRWHLDEHARSHELVQADAGGKAAKRVEAAEEAVEKRIPAIDEEIRRLQDERAGILREQHAATEHAEKVDLAKRRVEGALERGNSAADFALRFLLDGNHPYTEGATT